MNELPGDLLYTSDHEWLRREGDGSVTVGITEHAQRRWATSFTSSCLRLGRTCETGGEMAVVESVKAASDVYAPIAGSIAAVNDDLADEPEKINADPYGDGWIVRMTLSDGLDESELMAPDAYQQMLDELDD